MSPSQCTTNLCLICTCRRACPNPLVDLPRHGSFSVQIFTSFGVQVLCSDFAAVLDTCVPFPASYKNLKFSVRLLCPRAAPRLHPTWRPTQLPAPHQAYNAMPPPSLQSTGLLSLQSLQFEYNPLKGIQPWGYNTTPWRPWGTPVEYSRPSLLFKVKMYSVRQDFSANSTWGLRKPKPTMDTFKKLHSPRSYNLCVIMTTFSRTTGRQPACQNQTNRNAANYSHVPPVHQSRGNPTSLFPAPSLTDSPLLHQKCPPRKGPLWRWIQYSPDMVWSATSQQVQPQSVPIIDVFKMFSSI